MVMSLRLLIPARWAAHLSLREQSGRGGWRLELKYPSIIWHLLLRRRGGCETLLSKEKDSE